MWIGPLPPDSGEPLVVVVDPQSGFLVVEATERDGRVRRWTEEGWTLDGQPLDPEAPVNGHRMDGDRLVSAEALYGASQQFQYDEEGRIDGLIWANGGRLTVRYAEDGKVRELIGPGTQRWGLNWSDGLRLSDARGRATQISTVESDTNRSITVSDPLGRTVLSRYRKRDDQWFFTGWTDSRGLETRIGRYGGRLDVTAPGGRVFRLEVDDDGVVSSLAEPGGQTWRWERDEAGRLVRMFDPAGRVTRLEYGEARQPVVVSPSGRIHRIHRDADGQVVGIQEATGANTQLVRGDDGRVRSIIDAVGNSVFIERFANGWPSAVLERSGARWSIGIDSLGKPDRVEGPMGRVIQLHRDGGGRLERIEDSVHGTVKLVRDADGELSKVTDAQGRTTSFTRDGTGRLRTITQADDTTLTIGRDPMGEVKSVLYGDERIDIERRPDGRVRQVGAWSWERDINGRVRRMIGPQRAWTLLRDPAGWVRAIQVDDWRVDIQRDANGWPSVWSGVDGDEEVQRDASGRIVVDGNGTRVLRDSRGQPVRITASKVGEWRIQRDASGRSLSVRAPGGGTVSMDRDDVGRAKWFRFADGSMLRRRYEGSTISDALVDPNGHVAGQQQWTFNSDGQPEVRIDSDGAVWRYERDQMGRLLALQAEDGGAWIWGEDTVNDPDGRVIVRDASGRMMEAQLSPGQRAWGMASDLMSVHRGEHGELKAIGGDDGLAPVKLDALGRLVGFRPAASGPWSLQYDVQGRPVSLTRPDGTKDRWMWAPDADPEAGLSGILVTGEDLETPWAVGEAGMAVRLVDMEHEALVSDPMGTPVWVLDGSGGSAPVTHSPTGVPTEKGGGLVGIGAQLQWFAGGPIQWGSKSIDPVSGERVDGVQAWSWSVNGPGEWPDVNPQDPTHWEDDSSWMNPLHVLEEMGVIEPITSDKWRRLSRDPKAHEALPETLDGAHPPLGPHREALPLSAEDPITEAMLKALLPGGAPPEALTIAAALIEAEIDLPWLPPGLTIPGLEIWRNLGAWSE